MPVVVADLHSSLPAVLAGVRSVRPQARVAYLMTDGGALPAWFSRTVAGLRDAGWLAACVTVGQAFGGDLEAVTVHSGLLAARLVAGGRRRGRGAGAREPRHRHAVGVLRGGRGRGGQRRRRAGGPPGRGAARLGRGRAGTPPRAVPPQPDRAGPRGARAGRRGACRQLDGAFWDGLRAQAAELCAPAGRHRLVEVRADGLRDALAASPVRLSTMGRGLDDDEPAFLAAAAAGRHAATCSPLPPGDHAIRSIMHGSDVAESTRIA